MRVAAAAALAALVAAGAADARIRVGESIGGVRLGMTRAQVERVLGKPLGSDRERAAFGAETLTLYFGFAAYDVEFRGRDGQLRVSRVATGLRSEKTPEGISVGSSEVDLLKRYADVVCTKPQPRRTRRGTFFGFEPRTCAIRNGSVETAFATRQRRRFNSEDRWVTRTAEIYEISVRAL